MIKLLSKYHPAILIISVLGSMLTSANLRAEEPVPLSTQVTEETEGFLSDPARSGSLIGTIIAGAAIANPLSPILGSVAGYFIGKDNDYTNKDKAQKNAYARQGFIPENKGQVASLSLTGKQSQQAGQAGIIGQIGETGAGQQPQTGEQSAQLGLGRIGSQQQQLADACSHVDSTQQLPVFCYYYSQY
jgi:hypothetical protein